MFEEISVSKFDKNIFCEKLAISKETYSTPRDQQWAAKTCWVGRTLDSTCLK